MSDPQILIPSVWLSSQSKSIFKSILSDFHVQLRYRSNNALGINLHVTKNLSVALPTPERHRSHFPMQKPQPGWPQAETCSTCPGVCYKATGGMEDGAAGSCITYATACS